jgi:putative lysine transport system permease protein
MFIISINTGAYMSEIVRAGIQAVDSGQSEAARSLGMSSSQTMLLVVIPQAIKNTFPSIGNELIVNIKDSSVLNVISVTELFFQSNSIAGTVFKYKETFLVTAIIYLILTIICSRILGYIEQKMNQTKSSYPSSDTSIANQGL